MNKKLALRADGFTLIELLVVIAIIGILIGILTPALRTAMDRAKKARVKTELQTIKTAVQAYVNDYSKLPVPSGDQGKSDKEYKDTDSENIIKVLTANETANPKLNPRKIVYLETSSNDADGTFLDIWGTQYAFKLDNDYDGKVDKYSTIVIVTSAGPDKDFSSTNDNLRTVE